MTIEILAEGRFGRFVRDGSYEFVQRTGCTGVVSIVALTDTEELIFVEQYRRPVDRRTIELVAGLVGDEVGTESLLEAARRELLEEAGYHARQIEPLFVGPSAGGILSSIVNYYFAWDLEQRHNGGGVEGEGITVHHVPLKDAYEWLLEQSRTEVLVDPKVFLGIAAAERNRHRLSKAWR
ncbi:MAG: NUDIX hydrolase [Candidatus Hydrogenedentes bacterium]|nr:NUDIX hydrolase [Candidatus Hydrogenedentota bacterium]